MSEDTRNGAGSDDKKDAERDAWLREALRHAPDATAGAPPRLSEHILRQARQATATSAAATPRSRAANPPASWWSWLMQPSVAAGFAGVMVATLVGVMWWGRPIDEPLREANLPDPVVAAPAAATAVSPAPPAARAQASAEPAQAADASATPPSAATELGAAKVTVSPPQSRATSAEARTTGKELKATPVLADERARREVPTLSGAAAPATRSPPPAAAVIAAGPPAEAKREDEALAESARAGGRVAGADRSIQADMPAVAKAASPPAPAQPGSPARAEAAARDAASVVADGAPGLAAKPSQAARSASESASQLAPAGNPIARLRAAVAAGPDGWTWQRSNGPEQPMNDAVQGWLSQLDEVTRSRWQASLAATDSGMTLRLLRNGRLHTTVHVEASAVRVEATGDFTVPAVPTVPIVPRAALPAATAAALRAALEQATP